MICDTCEKIETINEQTIEEFFDYIFGVMCDEEMQGLYIVADEDNTKELLYYAINSDYEIGSIEINSNTYDGPYITYIKWADDNYTVSVYRARNNGRYYACDKKTFVQKDLAEKCEYVKDVINNKYVNVDLTFFEIGEEECEEPDDEPTGLYTYANEYKGDGVFAQIFVSSNLKDYVESVKEDFEEIFID